MLTNSKLISPSRVAGTLGVLLALCLAAACSDDKVCDPLAKTGCGDGFTCEVIPGGDPPSACFAPLVIRGQVFDRGTDTGIEGARVVALDVNNAGVSPVAVTDAQGNYELEVATSRLADGTPIAVELTLRADADGYVTFPSGLRQALPVDTSTATVEGGKFVVQSVVTDIALDADATAGDGQIHGTVAVNDLRAGALVVAETGTPARGYTAIADRDGGYRIFNLPAATYNVKAYSKGYNYTAGAADVTAGSDIEVNLGIDSGAASVASELRGSVQIVNGGMGTGTSVILVVESTYSETLERGQAAPGLRAPDPGLAPDVSGAFSITGVPAGRYVLLAAFENDFLVRDRSDIGGTVTLHIEVVSGMDLAISEGFKVTGALDVLSPGAMGPEQVTATPSFTWVDDSGEETYDLQVWDTFGTLVWELLGIPKSTGSDPVIPYAGPALVPGLYYQFRAMSRDNAGNELSRTEDLKGVFFVP